MGEYVARMEKVYIDAQESNCLAKYSNHRCRPNCHLLKVSRDVATKDISPFGTDEYEVELWLRTFELIKSGGDFFSIMGTHFGSKRITHVKNAKIKIDVHIIYKEGNSFITMKENIIKQRIISFIVTKEYSLVITV